MRARTMGELLDGVSAAGIRITDDWHWRMNEETRRVLAEDAKVQLSSLLFGHELRIDHAMPPYEVDIIDIPMSVGALRGDLACAWCFSRRQSDGRAVTLVEGTALCEFHAKAALRVPKEPERK